MTLHSRSGRPLGAAGPLLLRAIARERRESYGGGSPTARRLDALAAWLDAAEQDEPAQGAAQDETRAGRTGGAGAAREADGPPGSLPAGGGGSSQSDGQTDFSPPGAFTSVHLPADFSLRGAFTVAKRLDSLSLCAENPGKTPAEGDSEAPVYAFWGSGTITSGVIRGDVGVPEGLYELAPEVSDDE